MTLALVKSFVKYGNAFPAIAVALGIRGAAAATAGISLLNNH
jgi:hypothetical protein